MAKPIVDLRGKTGVLLTLRAAAAHLGIYSKGGVAVNRHIIPKGRSRAMAFFYLSIPAMILFLILAPLSLILVSHHEHKELRQHGADPDDSLGELAA